MTDNLDEVISLLTSVVHKIIAQVDDFEIEGQKLRHSLFIIDLIARKPDCTMKHISNELTLTPSTTTRHVDKLVDLDLVDRNISMRDRRSVVLFLTQNGEEVWKQFSKHQMDKFGPLLESFSTKEQGILVKLMQRIVEEI
jgi:DNA-binding MarR family transcriptional regulator